MKESIWAWWLVALGLSIIAIIMLVTDMTTTSDQNYHMIKEISEAAMIESVDYAHYRKYGELKMNAEKFMENFLRRYSEVVTINKTSVVSFYDVYEIPPKATIEISTQSTPFSVNGTSGIFNIRNRVDAILETYNTSDPNDKYKEIETPEIPPTTYQLTQLSEYIKSKATDEYAGYYDCLTEEGICTKTRKANMKWIVCIDYTFEYPNVTKRQCENRIDSIYDSLPQQYTK